MIRPFLACARDSVCGMFPEREEGQGMAEYGLILAGVALLAIIAVFLLGPKIGTLMNRISSSL